MTYDPDKHQRRSIRLRGYDYSRPGLYFITICTYDRICLFGEVVDGIMQSNAYGRIVADEWFRTEAVRSTVVLDAFVVMPNHVHGIIGIVAPDGDGSCEGRSRGGRSRGGVSRYAPTSGLHPAPPSGLHPAPPSGFQSPSQTVGAIVRGFKGAVTARINRMRDTPGVPIWQRGFHDHIIRHERALERIRRYILANPSRWQAGRNHRG